MKTQPVYRGLQLEGDLSQETWPSYLDSRMYARCAVGALGARVRTRQLLNFPGGLLASTTMHCHTFVGYETCSRLVAFDSELPNGTLLILNDMEGPHDFRLLNEKCFEPVRLVTLGYLMSFQESDWLDMAERLELRKFQNNRLEPGTNR